MLVYRVAYSALARYSPGQMANPKEENEEDETQTKLESVPSVPTVPGPITQESLKTNKIKKQHNFPVPEGTKGTTELIKPKEV